MKKLQDEEDKRLKDPGIPKPNDPKKPVAVEVEPDPTLETDAIKLEREKQEREREVKENKNVRANYENNLLKMVAESEKKNNLQKYNKMKETAKVNSVVSALRKQAEVKGQREFLIEQDKEKHVRQE